MVAMMVLQLKREREREKRLLTWARRETVAASVVAGKRQQMIRFSLLFLLLFSRLD